MNERRPSVGKRLFAAILAGVALLGPAAMLGDREPHRRAWQSAVARRPSKPRPGDRLIHRPGRQGPAVNPLRRKRRELERAYLRVTGKRLSSRTYVRLRKALARGWFKHRNSDCALWFIRQSA